MDKMMEMLRLTVEVYRRYSGSSMYMLLFLCGLLFLWVTEKDKNKKILLVYLLVAILGLFFFPVFAYIAIHYFLEEEVYYRFLWLLPMGVVVCYGLTQLIDWIEGRFRKIVIGVVCICFIAGSGSLIYQNPAITKATNLYQIPDSVIAVADELGIEETYVKAVVPSEMVQFIRLYDAYIQMPYGREILIDRWGMDHRLFDLMESESIYWTYLEALCQESDVEYIVLRDGTNVYGRTDEDRFEELTRTAGYTIYISKDAAIYEERIAMQKQKEEL